MKTGIKHNTFCILLLTLLFLLSYCQDTVFGGGVHADGKEEIKGEKIEHEGNIIQNKTHQYHDHLGNHAHLTKHEEKEKVGVGVDEAVRGSRGVNKDAVGTTVAEHDSEINKNKTGHHLHGTEAHSKDFRSHSSLYMILFSLFATFIGAGIILFRIRSSAEKNLEQDSEGFDVMKIRWIRRFVTWKYFRYIFIIPNLIIFLTIIYLGIFDIQDGERNIATVFTWTIWWSLIIFTFILAGRFWCMMCPFGALGDIAQKFISLNRTLPSWLQNMNVQTAGFLILTWAFTILAFGSSPFITAIVILIILTAVVFFSMIYQRRSFCRHLCPIGAVIGIYSMISPIELRSCNKKRCDAHKKKTCVEVCPMLESPEDMDNNIYCNFCMKCQNACPSRNLGLRLRAFGKDIYHSVRKSRTEAFAALLLLGVVIVETLAMTSLWKPLEDHVSTFTGITSPAVVYTIVFMLALLLPVGGFYLVCYLLTLWLGRNAYKTWDIVTPFAFLFIPLGVGLHFAHNIHHLLTESPIAIPATLRLLQKFGIGTSLPVNWNTAPLLELQPIFIIQMTILLVGFLSTLYVLYRLLKHFQKPVYHLYKMTVAMSLYAFVIVVLAIYMLGLPMSGRHVH